jgi:hypothetical protein
MQMAFHGLDVIEQGKSFSEPSLMVSTQWACTAQRSVFPLFFRFIDNFFCCICTSVCRVQMDHLLSEPSSVMQHCYCYYERLWRIALWLSSIHGNKEHNVKNILRPSERDVRISGDCWRAQWWRRGGTGSSICYAMRYRTICRAHKCTDPRWLGRIFLFAMTRFSCLSDCYEY